ncbi:hypothetical protein GCM10010967_14930 [Dyadobacter beijingensis]|uniref:Gliding motility-associated lipoprotein GldD n=1 Tax=Dyadobacter beijingensis TaxID=365489 RepID=A0ABQ2HLQ5_9BACT|nr:hypothetical protein [Dyadobacter beijingensis]GGM84134.1 hypothetical protein GCM10010967_14930 [Dyadobacter beijingensis]
MHKFSAIRFFSAVALFALALVMSCTEDHVVPDPEPSANCNRLNGQPRAFPCEFEMRKLEFMSGSSNTVAFATLTPADSLFRITGPYYSWNKTGTEDWVVRYKVRLTFKRIADGPQGKDNKYYLYMTVGGIDTEDFLNWGSDINTEGMAVGEERSQFFLMEYNLNPWTSITAYMRLLALINQDTYETLKKAPYNYQAVRDRAESWIRFKAID